VLQEYDNLHASGDEVNQLRRDEVSEDSRDDESDDDVEDAKV
jgi:hypothetical protein